MIKINKDTQRISLGMKQLQADPWDTVEEKFPIGSKHTGRVTNITDYGAFVELEPGIEGLVHVSEMSWTKKNVHPGKIVSTSQEVEVIVLEIDGQKRRVSLGPEADPGQPVGELRGAPTRTARQVEGEVKNITEFGLFVGLDGDIDGMVHLSRPRLEPVGRGGDPGLPQGRHRQGGGHRRGRREGAHLAVDQGGRGRSLRRRGRRA